MHATKLVVIGRDGILNEYREDHVKSPEEWVPLPGALEAVSRLNHAGWHVVVATNQSGIGRGMIDMATVNAVHAEMNRQLQAAGGRLDAVFFCPHTPEDDCECRKPRTGLSRNTPSCQAGSAVSAARTLSMNTALWGAQRAEPQTTAMRSTRSGKATAQ